MAFMLTEVEALINFYQTETRLWDANDDYSDIHKHSKELPRSLDTSTADIRQCSFLMVGINELDYC